MDTETLELLLGLLSSLWPTPLDDHELEVWKRTLAPAGGEPLDPEIAASVLKMLKSWDEFEFVRPSFVAFKSHYDRAYQLTVPPPPDPADQPVSRERAHEWIDDLKQTLKKPKAEPADETVETLL